MSTKIPKTPNMFFVKVHIYVYFPFFCSKFFYKSPSSLHRDNIWYTTAFLKNSYNSRNLTQNIYTILRVFHFSALKFVMTAIFKQFPLLLQCKYYRWCSNVTQPLSVTARVILALTARWTRSVSLIIDHWTIVVLTY